MEPSLGAAPLRVLAKERVMVEGAAVGKLRVVARLRWGALLVPLLLLAAACGPGNVVVSAGAESKGRFRTLPPLPSDSGVPVTPFAINGRVLRWEQFKAPSYDGGLAGMSRLWSREVGQDKWVEMRPEEPTSPLLGVQAVATARFTRYQSSLLQARRCRRPVAPLAKRSGESLEVPLYPMSFAAVSFRRLSGTTATTATSLWQAIDLNLSGSIGAGVGGKAT